MASVAAVLDNNSGITRRYGSGLVAVFGKLQMLAALGLVASKLSYIVICQDGLCKYFY